MISCLRPGAPGSAWVLRLRLRRGLPVTVGRQAAGQAGLPGRVPSAWFSGNRLARQKPSHIKTCSSLMRLSARVARRTAVIEITTFWFCYGWSATIGSGRDADRGRALPASSYRWLAEPFGVDTIKVRAKAPGSAWDGCRILMAFPSGRC